MQTRGKRLIGKTRRAVNEIEADRGKRERERDANECRPRRFRGLRQSFAFGHLAVGGEQSAGHFQPRGLGLGIADQTPRRSLSISSSWSR